MSIIILIIYTNQLAKLLYRFYPVDPVAGPQYAVCDRIKNKKPTIIFSFAFSLTLQLVKIFMVLLSVRLWVICCLNPKCGSFIFLCRVIPEKVAFSVKVFSNFAFLFNTRLFIQKKLTKVWSVKILAKFIMDKTNPEIFSIFSNEKVLIG